MEMPKERQEYHVTTQILTWLLCVRSAKCILRSFCSELFKE